jgi:hypothetical protein
MGWAKKEPSWQPYLAWSSGGVAQFVVAPAV